MHAVSDKAVVHPTSLLTNGQSPEDCRGNHINRGNIIESDFIVKTDADIRSFPTHQSITVAKVMHIWIQTQM